MYTTQLFTDDIDIHTATQQWRTVGMIWTGASLEFHAELPAFHNRKAHHRRSGRHQTWEHTEGGTSLQNA